MSASPPSTPSLCSSESKPVQRTTTTMKVLPAVLRDQVWQCEVPPSEVAALKSAARHTPPAGISLLLATLPLVVSFNFLLVLSKVGFDLHLLVVLVFLSCLCFHLQTWGPFTSPWNTFFSWPPEYHILSTLVHPHRFLQLSSPLSPPHFHHF